MSDEIGLYSSEFIEMIVQRNTERAQILVQRILFLLVEIFTQYALYVVTLQSYMMYKRNSFLQ